MDPEEYASRAQEVIPCDCRMISGCEDTQTSADVSNVSQFDLPDPAGRAGGACTSALLNVLYKDEQDTSQDLSFVQVLQSMRQHLRTKKYTQNPQLSASRQIDLTTPFRIVNPNNTGTKRAVLVGINYVGQQGQLSGCHNDVGNIKKYLTEVHGFSESNMEVLMDDEQHTNPTRANIMSALTNMVKKSSSGDSLFFHYSGHGGNLPDDNGDEEDGRDETLIPVDFRTAGQIRDDELLEKFVVPIPAGVTVTCLMDCCHSGTVLDLPYMFTADGSHQNDSNPQMKPNESFDYGKVAGVAMKVLPAAWKAFQNAKKKGDPVSAAFALMNGLAPLAKSVAAEWNKMKK